MRDELVDLATAWPAPRRGLFGEQAPTDVPPALAAALRDFAASGRDGAPHTLLYLAWSSEGELRARVLAHLDVVIAAVPARRWPRLDTVSRPGWGCYVTAWPLSRQDDVPGGPFLDAVQGGVRRWTDSTSLRGIRLGLGAHVAPVLLATMHPNGRVREAAVVALAGNVRGLPALLLRANDWARPVRDAALASLRPLVVPAHAAAWARSLPLLLRLDACGRAAHAPLIEQVSGLFRDASARAALLDVVRSPDTTLAQAAAAMALRTFGVADREVVAALLRCPDVATRFRVVDASTPALDGDLLDVALRDPVASVRRRALDVLRSRRPDEAVARLTEACFDRSDAVREYAVFHLQRAGAFDRAAAVAEARSRIDARRGDLLGALGFLCDLGGDEGAAAIRELAVHPRGRVRFRAKCRLARAHVFGEPLDPLLADDPNPKVARRLIAILRTRGIEPDLGRIAHRVADAPDDTEACAWLDAIASGGAWDALPHLLRAAGDRRAAVAARVREHLEHITKRTYRSWVDPGPERLDRIASALGACRDPIADAVRAWVRGVTGRRAWPDASPPSE